MQKEAGVEAGIGSILLLARDAHRAAVMGAAEKWSLGFVCKPP